MFFLLLGKTSLIGNENLSTSILNFEMKYSSSISSIWRPQKLCFFSIQISNHKNWIYYTYTLILLLYCQNILLYYQISNHKNWMYKYHKIWILQSFQKQHRIPTFILLEHTVNLDLEHVVTCKSQVCQLQNSVKE